MLLKHFSFLIKNFGPEVYLSFLIIYPMSIKFDGYIQNVYPIENSYTYADLSTYISTKSPSWGDPFNYSLYPYFEQSSITNFAVVEVDSSLGN